MLTIKVSYFLSLTPRLDKRAIYGWALTIVLHVDGAFCVGVVVVKCNLKVAATFHVGAGIGSETDPGRFPSEVS
jgi:hypothetical protein